MRSAFLLAAFAVCLPAFAGDNTWTSIGPDVGKFEAITWFSADIAWASSNDILYRSTDGGASWTRMGVLPEFGTVCGIAADPADADRVLIADCSRNMLTYGVDGEISELPFGGDLSAGQNIASSGDRLYVATQGSGVIYSSDGGSSWHAGSPSELSDRWVSSVEAHSTDAMTAWGLVFGTGVFFTTDGGQTWTKGDGLGGGFVDVSGNPASATGALAVNGGSLFRTMDSGAHWSSYGNGYSGTLVSVEHVSSDGLHVLAISEEGQVFESNDGGANWSALGVPTGTGPVNFMFTNGENVITTTVDGSFTSTDDGASWHAVSGLHNLPVTDFVQSRNDPDVIYLANYQSGVYRSEDGGKSWTLQRNGLVYGGNAQVGYTADALALAGSTEVPVLSGYELSVFSSESESWSSLGSNAGMNFQAVAAASDDAAHVVAAFTTEGGGTRGVRVTLDSGAKWTIATGIEGKTINTLAFDPADSNIVFAGVNGGGIWRSTDGGFSWSEVYAEKGSGTSSDIVVDPMNSDTIYFTVAYGADSVLVSHDGGATWSNFTIGLYGGLQAIAIYEPDPRWMAVATNTEHVYLTSNGGDSWEPLLEGVGHEVGGPYSLAFDTSGELRLLAGYDDIGLVSYTINPDPSPTPDPDDDEEDEVTPPSSSGGGGGGAPDVILLLLASLGIVRFRSARPRAN